MWFKATAVTWTLLLRHSYMKLMLLLWVEEIAWKCTYSFQSWSLSFNAFLICNGCVCGFCGCTSVLPRNWLSSMWLIYGWMLNYIWFFFFTTCLSLKSVFQRGDREGQRGQTSYAECCKGYKSDNPPKVHFTIWITLQCSAVTASNIKAQVHIYTSNGRRPMFIYFQQGIQIFSAVSPPRATWNSLKNLS